MRWAPIVLILLAPAALAQAVACPRLGATLPAGANTTDRSRPFFVDTAGLALSTTPPTRDPANPAYPSATALPGGTLPSLAAEGNFIIGPSHTPAPETFAQSGVPHGRVSTFALASEDSLIYRPGIVRDDPDGCFNAAIFTAATAPGDPSNLIVPTSHAGKWARQVDVYVPAQYRPGADAPFIVFGDGGPAGFANEPMLFTVLDNLIAAHRLPAMVAIGIGAGGQDAQGSERGREYDAVSGLYAEWVETEVLPRVEQTAGVRLTQDPDGRATMGLSSSGSAAFTMAWFHPELYHRVLAYSPTLVNQQWPHDPALPGGAWEFHSPWPGAPQHNLLASNGKILPSTGSDGAPLIPNSPAKPIRFWFETGDRDYFYYIPAMADGMHDWTLANERMAAVLGEKGYHYQFVFSRNAGHVDGATEAQTLPYALEWLWQGYQAVSSN